MPPGMSTSADQGCVPEGLPPAASPSLPSRLLGRAGDLREQRALRARVSLGRKGSSGEKRKITEEGDTSRESQMTKSF